MEETFPPTQGRAVDACAYGALPQPLYSDLLCVRSSLPKPSTPHPLPRCCQESIYDPVKESTLGLMPVTLRSPPLLPLQSPHPFRISQGKVLQSLGKETTIKGYFKCESL